MIGKNKRASPSFVANTILDELGIANIRDLRHLDLIAFQRGAIVRDAHLDTAEARLTVGGRYAIITVSTAVDNARRKRFSIAHELGHLEMHRYERTFSLCLSDDLNDWASKLSNANLEQEANEFAASFLLPEKLFAPLCNNDPSMEYIIQLSDKFNTSITATGRRYTQFCLEPVAIVWSQRGYIKWFQGSEAFTDLGVFVDVNSLVSSRSVVSQHFEKGLSLPSRSQSVEASAWFRPGSYPSDARIKEQSIAMPRYEGVLTLLWVDEELFGDEELWL